MSTRTGHLPRYPMLGRDAATQTGLMIQGFSFRSNSPLIDPASNGACWPGPVTFGHEGEWTPTKHGLSLEAGILFNPSILFGTQGVACSNAVLAITLEWVATDSRQRGNSNHVELRRSSGRTQASFSLTFEPGQIRGNVSLGFNVFILSPDPHPKDTEEHLANSPGLYLGALGCPCILAFDGEASVFPVMEYNGSPKDPLWNIQYETADPCEDPFAAPFIALQINTAHPDYSAYRGNDAQSESTPLERQIVASWLSAFLLILKEKSPDVYADICNGTSFDRREGSIAHFAEYLFSTFTINSESITNIITTVQKTVEEKLPN